MSECDICSRAFRRPRLDLAPSPIQPRATYSFFGTLSELEASKCLQCAVLADGVLHFAQIFRPGEQKKQEISIECSSLFDENPFTEGIRYPPEEEDSLKRLPRFLEITFGFLDRPEMSKINLQVTASDIFKPHLALPEHIERCQKKLNTWISDCEAKHGDKCRPLDRNILPSRLLDISKDSIRLVDAAPACQEYSSIPEQPLQYTALSHCWGPKATVLTTTSTNISSMRTGTPLAKLPKTFQDAILITRQLGLQFIWIDSLCIVQDDENDWEIQAAHMAAIYQNAFLTIAATRAPDSDAGCFSTLSETPYLWRRLSNSDGERSEGASTQVDTVHHPLLWKPIIIRKAAGKTRFSRWFALRPGHDIRNLAGSVHRSSEVQKIILAGYPLLSRAWVFQERLLSPRVVHFGHIELAWECRSSFWTHSFVPETRDMAEEQLKADKREFTTSWLGDGDPGYQPPIDIGRNHGIQRRIAYDQPDKKRQKPLLIYPIERMRQMFITLMQAPRPENIPEADLDSRTVGELVGVNPEDTWNILVEEFTRLNITKEMDRLPALSGIAVSVFGPVSWWTKANTEYLAGIWSSQLPAALYWTTSSSKSRRPVAYRAPSFSWASVEGPIEYRHAPSTREIFSGDSSSGYTSWRCEPVTWELKFTGIDPFGRVDAGWLELRGWTGRATIAEVSQSPRQTGGAQCVLQQTQGQQVRRQKFYADLPIPLGTSEPAEVSEGDNVLLLLLECVKRTSSTGQLYPHNYTVMVLVLKPSTSAAGAWQRIGLVHPADDLRMYFMGCEGIGADIGADVNLFEYPSPWFTSKEVVRIV